ncbi:MAG: glucosylceramidase [Butyrivibrio sp.]|nr:glucosylceramidase [Acetatifactor muris]MCM1558397.1 glucosylceramidase [Butyrivibrio sp.]
MKDIKIIVTDKGKEKYWEEQSAGTCPQEDFIHVIKVYPELQEQTMEGFGGAFTEAAAVSWNSLEEGAKQEFLEGCFGEKGLKYNLGRIHMNSCDFALGNYTYVEEGDTDLATFDISHDREQIIPLIKKAAECHGGEELSLLVSPWSPPAFMKTNGEMNHGGKLKEEYYGLWADYYVRFLQEAGKEGLHIRYLTVQNEPEAVQTWDSCVYTAEEEGVFAAEYLIPALQKAGLGDIEVFIWDHNKENMYDRAKGSFQVPGCREKVSGVAMHWYTGDHFDGVRAVKKAFPEKKVFFTEGCVEYSRFADSGEVQKAEMYAHDMLGNFKAGTEAFFDWNLLLNAEGGPNHVRNFCAAPIMCDGKGGIEKRLSYYYIGHFSRYIQRGARQVMNTCYSDTLETAAFVNSDGSRVVVILNRGEKDMPVYLCENGQGMALQAQAHTIRTVVYS